MSELRECPFCGVKGFHNIWHQARHKEGCFLRLYADNCQDYYTKIANGQSVDDATSPRVHENEEMAEAWNARAERTCEMTDNSDYTMLCSCGEEIDYYMTEHYADGTAEYSYMYCPHCGAKVVTSDTKQTMGA